MASKWKINRGDTHTTIQFIIPGGCDNDDHAFVNEVVMETDHFDKFANEARKSRLPAEDQG